MEGKGKNSLACAWTAVLLRSSYARAWPMILFWYWQASTIARQENDAIAAETKKWKQTLKMSHSTAWTF